LKWQWDLLPEQCTKCDPDKLAAISIPELPSISEHEQLYLTRGYEQHLKMKLIETWGEWLTSNMQKILKTGKRSCHYASSDPGSEEAKWEIGGLDILLALEWMKRDVALLEFSIELENILEGKMEKYIEVIKRKDVNEQQRLTTWMRSEFKVWQQKRLVIEMVQAKARMLEAWEAGANRAEKRGQ
jgi:hypothetical protein